MSTRLTPLALGLVALLLWLTLRPAPPLRVDVGAPGDGRFLWGFYEPEQGDGASFRWSGPEARLLLHGAPPGAALLELRLSGERLVAQGAPALSLDRDGVPVATFDLTPGWRVYRLLLPPGGDGATPLALRSALSTPGAGAQSRDYRALGVPLDWLQLTRLPGEPGGALARALWLTWAVGLVATLVGLAFGRAGERRRSLASLAGGGLATAAALLWAWRDPYGLAWALPATPWILGVPTLLLAGSYLWRRERGQQSELLLLGCLVALAAAMGLMHGRTAVGLGVALAVVALLALGAPAGGLGAGIWPPREAPDLGRREALLGLGAIVALALALRLFRLDELPFGLWRDEARHGLVALRIAEDPSYRPIYVLDERVQLPGLGLYPFALALKLLGPHLWTMRLVTALAGALTAVPFYAVAARIAGSRAIGLLAALLLAVSSWHISISRFAFPTIYEPLLSLSAWWLLLVALDPRQGDEEPGRQGELWAAGRGLLAGALLGVAAQTYHIGRVTPLAAGWLALLLLATEPRAWRRWLVVAGAAVLGLVLTLAPLLSYALARPGEFNERIGAVFLLSEEGRKGAAPLAALDASVGRHLLMFTVEGDANGRHHAPQRPMLDILSGLGLLLGLAALLRRLGDWRSRFLLGALAIGLLPSLLAVDSPHGMRGFGALAPACLIAALGWGEVWGWFGSRKARKLRREKHETKARSSEREDAKENGAKGAAQRLSAQGQAALAIFVAGLIGLNAWLYFGIMPADPRVFAGFYPVQSWMGVYVADAEPDDRLYVPAEVRDHPSFAFLAAGRPVEVFSITAEGAPAELSAPPASGDTFLLSGYFADDELAALAPILGGTPEPLAAGPPFPDGRGPTYYVVRSP